MKLLRFGPPGRERPGVLAADGLVRDLDGILFDLGPAQLTADTVALLAAMDLAALPVIGHPERLGPPLSGVGKIVGIGLNYRDHAAEAGLPLPAEPVLFLKATSSLAGPRDPLPYPEGAAKLDYEVELAVVIGRTARHVAAADALSHVAGYAVMNDVSERGWQLERGGQWDKGKGADGFAPFGPYLVTADEVPDPQALRLWCRVNGAPRQDGRTADMVFPVAALIAYVSRFMTLHPGDVITTGTPAGVGWGIKPEPLFLRRGDVVEMGIDGLGEQRLEIR